MVELAEAVEAGRVHMVSSIAAAGLYKGTWREDMFDEAQDVDNHPYFRTKHESERVVREECTRPWRVYRPGIVVGHSETGEMDKVDGPYYFFKLIRRIRQIVPQWMPMPGRRGARDQHRPGRLRRQGDGPHRPPGRPRRHARSASPTRTRSAPARSSTSSPAPRTRRSPRFARPASSTESLAPLLGLGLSNIPFANGLTDRALADFGIPRSVLMYLNYPTHFDSRRTEAALAGTDISVPPLEAYAGKLWDYWARHLDPDLFRDRTLMGAAKGRAGSDRRPDPDHRAADPRRGPPGRQATAGQHLAREVGARQRRHGHRRVIGNRQVRGDEDRRRRRHRPARRADAGEARGDPRPDRGDRRRWPTSIAAISPTSTTSTGWRPRCSNSTATSTS